ncbi:MAG TPA: glycosyl transferase [Anaerolineae bacterium]|nr:glycosyl transferase [Anaerolineae bacterium]
MRYGYFDDKNREYVITQPDTPLPWINYLGSEAYFGLISNTAGGYSFYRDARLRRITRYRYNNVPLDFGGRYLYLRDNATGAFWSPSWQPTRTPLDSYTCRHGMGYTIIESANQQISAKTLYFVPLGANLEIWSTTITNQRDTVADLSLFSLIEFCLWDAWDDATNYQRNFNIAQVEIEDGVIYHKTEYRERRDHFAYFACSAPLAGYDTHREDFLGPYRGWDKPVVVERGESANSEARSWAPIGSHHVKLTLQPGESRRIIFLLGYQENPRDQKFDPPDSQIINKRLVKPIIAKYLQPETVDAAFADLRAYWDGILGIYQVDTPDMATNRMVNVWNAYQCMVTFNMSRSASYFESGVGRGLGFRDSSQDLLGFVHQVPARARERILDLAATQLANGGAYHQFQPLTKRGNDAVGSGFNDDPLWLPLAVVAYIKETGDFDILNAPVPYENKPGTETPLAEHLERAINYTLNNLGPHGLPLIGRADWNDCLNLNIFSDEPGESFQVAPLKKDGKVAESVFIAVLFVLAAKEMAALSDKVNQRISESANQVLPFAIRHSHFYLDAAAKMEQTIWAHGWDGAWFLRAYDAFGEKVGSHECAEGQIFIEPQGVAIMAGLGLDDGRAELALASVKERLATEHGIVLQQPAYSRYYLHLGEISSYPPGFKENASIFCHTNPWIMIGEAIVGHGDQAFDYYKRICPAAREGISEIHRCEPYVYAQTIAGRDNPRHGEAKNSWLTGTAAWNYVAITQWILGIRPSYDGLQIAPVIPMDWQGFTATRIFRGVTYHITVERQGGGNTVSLVVDGKPVEGNIVPLPAPEVKDVTVKVTLR